MSIRALVVSVLLLPFFQAHAETVPLPVGGTTIQFPAPAGYVAISKDQPKLFEYLGAALPPGNRLVEAFYTPEDLGKVLSGGKIGDLYYQVQVLRSMEQKELSVGDWNRLKPELLAVMQKLDVDEIVSKDGERSDRMSKVAEADVDVTFGKIGAVKLYRETPNSITYGMLIPITVTADDEAVGGTFGMAGATLLLRNKLVYVYAYTSDASASGIGSLHRDFDAIVDKMMAINASDPGKASATGFDWRKVFEKALIGGLIGAVVGLLAWLKRKRAS